MCSHSFSHARQSDDGSAPNIYSPLSYNNTVLVCALPRHRKLAGTIVAQLPWQLSEPIIHLFLEASESCCCLTLRGLSKSTSLPTSPKSHDIVVILSRS